MSAGSAEWASSFAALTGPICHVCGLWGASWQGNQECGRIYDDGRRCDGQYVWLSPEQATIRELRRALEQIAGGRARTAEQLRERARRALR